MRDVKAQEPNAYQPSLLFLGMKRGQVTKMAEKETFVAETKYR